MSTNRTPNELLGEITVPTGVVVLLDAGLLGLWDPEDAWVADHPAVDFRIEGSDAEEAGKRFDRQWHPRYLYDIPQHAVDEVRRTFNELVAAAGLTAELVPVPEGISKHDRVALALEFGNGTGVVEFYGIRAIVVSGVPRDRALRIEGARMKDAEFADRWRWVTLEVDEGTVARTEEIDLVFVDEARLMFADAQALREWKHEDSLDGLADYLFWGEDAAAVAQRHDAPGIDAETFGWRDVPTDEAVTRGLAVQDTREREELQFAVDFRPHSHHHMVLEQMRASATESGTIELGGARVCAFFTTWGDGGFPVLRELDDNGALLRLRVDLGNSETVARHREIIG